ncbi:porin [Parabacteroides sp. FAFU027]|uniref:porin n=1 Tax=Parabacteroides sp. FAFU027 TaxID=2922715 RepID=UPI001FAF83EA|nr:porin [Parabacteroides sp. FAFU027]
MRKIVYAFLLLIISVFAANAQQTSENVLKLLAKKNVITAKEADSLIAVEKKATPAKSLYLLDKVKVFGYAHIGYSYSDTLPQRQSYGVKRIISFIEGKLTDNITFQIQSNLGPTPALVEYWMEYAPKTFLKLKVGQMKLPFSIENAISQSVLENVTNSQAINNLVGGSTDVLGAGNMAGRDCGIQIGGSFLSYQKRNLVDYQLGIFNGNGVNNMDNNRHKDFVGTLMFNPLSYLKVGGSLYAGKANYKNVAELGDAKAVDHLRNRWSLGGEITTKYVYGRAEYVHGTDAHINREGYYALLNGHVCPKIDVIAEYDFYNKNVDVNGKKFTNYQIGMQWNFYKRSRFQLHYVYKDNNAVGVRSENAVLGQLQVGF